MRKNIFVSMLCVVLLAAAACGGSTDNKEGGSKKDSQIIGGGEAGSLSTLVPAQMRGKTLRATIGNTFAPIYFEDENGKLAGVSPELANAAARLLGIKHEYKIGDFASAIPGLKSGKYDVALVSADMTPERVAEMDFVPYTSAGYVLLRRAAAKKLADDMCGQTIADVAGGTGGDTLKAISATECKPNGKPAIKISTFPTQADTTVATKSGRADGVVIADIIAGDLMSKEDGWVRIGTPFGAANQGWILPKGSPLGDAYAAAINALIEDGTYAKIMKKWNLATISLHGKSIVNNQKAG